MKGSQKRRKKILIEIDCKFATPFQERVAKQALYMMIDAWRFFYSDSHKNNDIKEVKKGIIGYNPSE
jgi:hypothetical protein